MAARLGGGGHRDLDAVAGLPIPDRGIPGLSRVRERCLAHAVRLPVLGAKPWREVRSVHGMRRSLTAAECSPEVLAGRGTAVSG